MDTWSDWLQRRLGEQLTDPDLLTVLAGSGRTRRTRQTADVRRALLLGRALSEQELTSLLDVLCTEVGLDPDARGRLMAETPDDVEAFVDAVLMADGLDPLAHDRRSRSRVRRHVTAAFQRERQRRLAL